MTVSEPRTQDRITKALLLVLILGLAGCDQKEEPKPDQPDHADQAWTQLFYNLHQTTHLNLLTAMTSMCTVDVLGGREENSASCLNICLMTDSIDQEIAEAPAGIKREYLERPNFCEYLEKRILKRGQPLPVWSEEDWKKLEAKL